MYLKFLQYQTEKTGFNKKNHNRVKVYDYILNFELLYYQFIGYVLKYWI